LSSPDRPPPPSWKMQLKNMTPTLYSKNQSKPSLNWL
jgi:hypothetical protein